ncbi:MAG TPA: glycosyltransferase family 9 protein [Solirubrobacteraceae bacterium]|nr:glycosyltransferase family 9 protein [Solirubrobacteraceae bacterium]
MSRIVVLRALGLGDLLCAVPALRAVRRAFPDGHVLLATPRALAPIASLSGAVDGVLDARPLRPLPPGAHGATVAINLHGSGPESHGVLLDAAPQRLIAFRHPDVPASGDGPPWPDDEHERARWCRLLEHAGIEADPEDLELDARGLGRLPRRGPTTVVHPGAASAARRWPVERWAAVARSERATGRQVLVTGSPAERPLAREVAARAALPDRAVVAGRTDVGGLAALVAGADRVVCGDTGIAHLASALRTPSVVLFGPVSPRLWGPPPDRAWHRVLWAGRTGDPHAERPDAGLLEIDVVDVVLALADLPAPAPAPVVSPAS